ncbi:MAG: hypothetical protein ACRC28_04500 [Clostridium sp.]|uniref:hypothetical protein n=1 Tax=Clostridium sp. TaxID=1506 RepID=UPI003F32A651
MNKFQKRNLRLFLLSLIVIVVAIACIGFSIITGALSNLGHIREYSYSADVGIAGTLIVGAAFCMFLFRRVIKYLSMDELIDAVLKFFTKILQKIHIPLGMLAVGVISFHVYIFISLGFKWTLGYIFGAFAGIVLLIMVVSGLLRIFNKGIKSHKGLGIALIVLIILHIALIKYFPLAYI